MRDLLELNPIIGAVKENNLEDIIKSECDIVFLLKEMFSEDSIENKPIEQSIESSEEDKISENLRLEMIAQKLYILIYLNNVEKAKKFYEDLAPEDKRYISNSNKLVFIRTYVLISGTLDPAESEVQYATSKADKAYKRVDALKKDVEAKLYKNSVKRIKELHPNWTPVIKDEK